MLVDPKSIKIQSSCQYLFVLLGSRCVKVALKMLVKTTPDIRTELNFLFNLKKVAAQNLKNPAKIDLEVEN